MEKMTPIYGTLKRENTTSNALFYIGYQGKVGIIGLILSNCKLKLYLKMKMKTENLDFNVRYHIIIRTL